jgi:hypothetical protein
MMSGRIIPGALDDPTLFGGSIRHRRTGVPSGSARETRRFFRPLMARPAASRRWHGNCYRPAEVINKEKNEKLDCTAGILDHEVAHWAADARNVRCFVLSACHRRGCPLTICNLQHPRTGATE